MNGRRSLTQKYLKEKGYSELVRKPSQSSENSRVECPGFRKVPDLEPVRATPRHNAEVCLLSRE